MAVAQEPGRRAVRELGAEADQRGATEARELRDPPGWGARGSEGGQGLLDHGGEPVRAAVSLDGCGGVEARDGGADSHEVGFDGLAVGELGGEGRRLVIAVHRDGVLDRARIVLGRHGEALGSARDQRDHVAVDVRGEAVVEPQLGVAALPPAREAAVIHEREADGLLDLVRRLAGEEDPRDVRLAQLDRIGAGRIGRGVEESVGQLENRRRGTALGRCSGSHDLPFHKTGASRRCCQRTSATSSG